MSAEGMSRRVHVPHLQAIGGPTWGLWEHCELPQWDPGQSPGRQQFFHIYIIQIKSLQIQLQQVSISIRTVK